MRALIGLLYLAGIYQPNRLYLDELWRTDDFKCVMAIVKFRFLKRASDLITLARRRNEEKTDPLAPIRDIFEACNLNFQNCYNLRKR